VNGSDVTTGTVVVVASDVVDGTAVDAGTAPVVGAASVPSVGVGGDVVAAPSSLSLSPSLHAASAAATVPARNPRRDSRACSSTPAG
jgi:hypothetical protein